MLKNFHKYATAAAISMGLVFAPLMAWALQEDPQVYSGGKIIPPRVFYTQQVAYVRGTINFNDPNIGNGVWFASIPAGAYILSMDAYVTTAFNAASTNLLTIGATKTGADWLASSGANASVTLGSTGLTHLTAAAGLGLAVTNNTSLQTGYNASGLSPIAAYVPVFARYTQTGTAATAGVVTVVIAYVQNNDQ